MPTVQGTDLFTNVVAGSYDAFFNVDGVDPSGVTSPVYQDSTHSLKITPTGSNEGIRKNLTGSPSRGWTGFAYQVDAAPSGGQGISRIHSNISNLNATLSISTGMVLFVFITGGSSFNGPTISADTWYWIEQIYNVTGTTHTLLWRVNGVDQTSATATGTASDSVTYAQPFSTSGGATWYAGKWSWGSAANDADWLGEPSAGVEKQSYYAYRRRSYR